MTAAKTTDPAPRPQLSQRLPDWFEAIHDPEGIIARGVLRLDQLIARRGVRLYVQTDFRALKETVEQGRGLGTVLMPHLDPDYSAMSEENGYWILGVDERGNPATIVAGRYYDFSNTSLAAELRSFRFFYDDPSRHLTPECFCNPPVEAETITGPAFTSGAFWVHPDFRGPDAEGLQLSKMMGPINRLLGLARWWPKTMFTFSRYELYNRGSVGRFGYAHEAFETTWHFPYGPVPASGLFWITREETLQLTADEVRQQAAA